MLRSTVFDGPAGLRGRVGRRLFRLEIPVLPVRRVFRVLDPAADPDGPGSPGPPDGALVTAGRDQMLVACAQEHTSVLVTIEEWEDAPPPFYDVFEDEAKCVLYLRGQLSVADISLADRALGSVRLSGGTGDYGVHVYTRNRAEAIRAYTELYQMHANPLSDDFQRARRQIDGLEQYLIQLWRES